MSWTSGTENGKFWISQVDECLYGLSHSEKDWVSWMSLHEILSAFSGLRKAGKNCIVKWSQLEQVFDHIYWQLL